MKLNEIREIAKSHGIQGSKLSKTDLVRSIQSREGNFDCFATAINGDCDQSDCRWREDCFDTAKKGELS